MGFLNIFKKEKKAEGKKEEKKEEKTAKEEKLKKAEKEREKSLPSEEEKKKEKKVEEKVSPLKPQKKREKKLSKIAFAVLDRPHITEKATSLAEENCYVFRVYKNANKIEIKKAVEDVYGVNVVSVRIINVPPKRRRVGRHIGWRKGYKKAIVKIEKGQKIEILPR